MAMKHWFRSRAGEINDVHSKVYFRNLFFMFSFHGIREIGHFINIVGHCSCSNCICIEGPSLNRDTEGINGW